MDHHNDIMPARSRHRSAGRGILLLIIGFSILSILPGCSLFSPKIIEKIIVQHDTTSVHHRDSIYFKDSIYVKEWMKGDTVYLDRWHDRYVYKDRWRDSISIKEVHDTTTVEKKVEKELTAGQKAKISLFPWLLLVAIGFGVWTFRKPILALVKRLL